MTTLDKDLDNLRERVTSFCEEEGYDLSPQAEDIFRDIINLKKLTGEEYCPCQKKRTPETVCVCLPVRNGLVKVIGACFCNLILSKNEEE